MTNVGVFSQDGQWNWTCGCGTSGQSTPDRDACREDFKKHRRSCSLAGSITPAAETKPKEGTSTMSTKKATTPRRAAAKKSGNKARERAVSEKEALSVIEKLKSGKSSVMAEARRLGCYHATLRKALRAAIGEGAYTKLMSGKKGNGGGAKKAAPAAKKPAKKKAAARKRATPKTDTPADVPAAVEPSVTSPEAGAQQS